MAPLLEAGTLIDDADGKKYVLVEGGIFYGPQADSHVGLVRDLAALQGRGLKDIKRSDSGKPLVDAAGTITNVGGKFAFGIGTLTCDIKYDGKTAQKMAQEVASEILGDEKVHWV